MGQPAPETYNNHIHKSAAVSLLLSLEYLVIISSIYHDQSVLCAKHNPQTLSMFPGPTSLSCSPIIQCNAFSSNHRHPLLTYLYFFEPLLICLLFLAVVLIQEIHANSVSLNFTPRVHPNNFNVHNERNYHKTGTVRDFIILCLSGGE